MVVVLKCILVADQYSDFWIFKLIYELFFIQTGLKNRMNCLCHINRNLKQKCLPNCVGKFNKFHF